MSFIVSEHRDFELELSHGITASVHFNDHTGLWHQSVVVFGLDGLVIWAREHVYGSECPQTQMQDVHDFVRRVGDVRPIVALLGAFSRGFWGAK